MSNLNAIKNAKDFDELEKAGQETHPGGTEGLTWEQIDAAYNARASELRAQGIVPWWEEPAPPAEPERPAVPTLTVTQRNHWLLLDVQPRGYRFEVARAVSTDTPWYRVTERLRGAHGSENALPVPVRWRTIAVRVRWEEHAEWSEPVLLKNDARPRKLSPSNAYWHYWSINDREGFSRVCRDCVPGVNERDKDGNTIGHIIAGAVTRPETDQWGNFVDDRSYNRGAWLGSLIGDGTDDYRGAGLDVTIKNKHGETVRRIWEANGSELAQEKEGYAEVLCVLAGKARTG